MSDPIERWAALSAWEIAGSYPLMMLRGAAILYLYGLVAFVVERLRPADVGAKFFKKDFLNELCYPLFNNAVTTPIYTLISVLLISFVLIPFVPHHVFQTQVVALPFWLQVLLFMLLSDIAVWIEHWLAHRYLWEFHALHHMTPEVSWLTYARVHPVNGLTIALSSLVAHFVLGFESSAVAVAAAVIVPISSWEHANLDFAWPKPFCYLFTSPRFHRWHHAREADAVDKNFCLIFPFLDLLMGTYYCPDRMPHAYGIYSAPGADDEGARIPTRFRDQLVYPFVAFAHRMRGTLPPARQ